MPLNNWVDSPWLVAEGKMMCTSSSPKYPLIVGGSGMIGSNLVVLLASNPECMRVTVLDIVPPNPNLLKGTDISDSKITYIQHKIGTDSEEALVKAMDGIDCVFTTVTPDVQCALEIDFYKTNINGMQEVIKACGAKKIRRLVYLSSIAVSNHFVDSVNQDEVYPLPPIQMYDSPYDITKRKGEEAVLAANQDGVLATCSLRPGGVLCAPHDFTFRNLFLPIPGILPKPGGMKNIDFIDGADLSRAMLLAAQKLNDSPADVAGDIFWTTKGANVNPSNPREIAELASNVLQWWLLPVPEFVVHRHISDLGGHLLESDVWPEGARHSA